MHLFGFLFFLAPLFTLAQEGGVTNVDENWPNTCYNADNNTCIGIVHDSDEWYCGDSRLGPKILPDGWPFNIIFASYARTGTLCPAEFLEIWINETSPNQTYYNLPAGDGFAFDAFNITMNHTMELPVGMKLDRFGPETGRYLAAFGTPFIERALYPSALNTRDPAFPSNYRVYKVIKRFTAQTGPVAGWFEQPGMGTQFYTGIETVGSLITGGFLEMLTAAEYPGIESIPTPKGAERPGAWKPAP